MIESWNTWGREMLVELHGDFEELLGQLEMPQQAPAERGESVAIAPEETVLREPLRLVSTQPGLPRAVRPAKRPHLRIV